MGKLSPHIDESEYRCFHCHKLPPDLYKNGQLQPCYQDLFDSFESIRMEWGKPIVISSGYRCPEHNTEVGGEQLSVHLVGLALDLYVDKKDTDGFVAIARGRGLRIGWRTYTDPLVHVDVGFLWIPRASEWFREGVEW